MFPLERTRSDDTCIERINLNFFGVNVRLWLTTSEDFQHFAWHYRSYISEGSAPPDFDLLLSVHRSPMSFRAALMDQSVEKSIYMRRQGSSWKLWESWKQRSRKASPLPPFGLAPLCETYRLIHASAVSLGGDRAAVFLGPSGAGKSTIALAFALRGYDLLADDTLPIDADGNAFPFARPLNLRPGSVQLFPAIARKVQASGVATHLASGSTMSCRPEDLGISIASHTPRRITRIIRIGNRHESQTVTKTATGARISGDWKSDYESLVAEVSAVIG